MERIRGKKLCSLSTENGMPEPWKDGESSQYNIVIRRQIQNAVGVLDEEWRRVKL